MKMLALLSCVVALSAAGSMQRPVPPGEVAAERATQRGEQGVPAPLNQPARPSFQQVQREADQIATLTRNLPNEVSQLSKGLRPSDLDQKLKAIEKLSKRLRSDLRRM